MFGKRKIVANEEKLRVEVDSILTSGAVAQEHLKLFGLEKAHQFLANGLFYASVSKMFEVKVVNRELSHPTFPVKTLQFIIWMHSALTCEVENIDQTFKEMPLRNTKLKSSIRDIRAHIDTVRINTEIKIQEKESVLLDIVNAQKNRIQIRTELNGRTLLEWLKQHGSDPELWHYLLPRVHDWGGKADKIFSWVVRHPDCDAGTAAEVFHLFNPFDNLKPNYPDYRRAKIKTLKHIITRWENDDFKTFNFGFQDILGMMETEESHREYERKFIEKHGRINFISPASIFELREGKTPDPAYHYE